jgi:cell wall-associated NlpC family hydrolase
VRPVPPGWGPAPRPGWGYHPPQPGRRRPELGGVTVLVVVTVLAALAAPHAHKLRGVVEAGAGLLPAIRLPRLSQPTPEASPGHFPDSSRARRAVAYAVAQRGKPYRWAAAGPAAFDCSGLTWAAWRAAGVRIPRTAAGQLTGLPRIRGRLQPGDLLVYRSRGPSRRHVAIVVGPAQMVEAPGRGRPVRSARIRPGYLGAVRPGAAP